MNDPVLKISHLSKSYGALRATDDISLDLLEGEIHTLIGPNGAGKSTLVGQIAGWIKPDEGSIWLNGNDVTRDSVSKRSLAGLGRSFQVSCLATEMSARRNVMLSVQARQASTYRFWKAINKDKHLIDEADKVLQQLHLTDHRHVLVSELSHGKRRELEVACALALKPKMLLLDEPMAGLDQESTNGLVEFLLRIKDSIPVLLVEHDMDAVFRLSTRISVLVYGKIVETGSAGSIRNSAVVKEAYLGTTDD